MSDVQNLLTLRDLQPPMGDTAGQELLAGCRALWTVPLDGEDGAPEHRIVHARTVQLHAPARLRRLGLRRAPGYHKCGSTVDLDWVTALRVLVWDGASWRVEHDLRDLECPDETTWIDLDGLEASTLRVEVRRCGIDGWWPSWNLAMGALVLEGEPLGPVRPRQESLLDVTEVSLSGLPRGLTAEHTHGEVRYRSEHLEVGFCLNRAGFSHLALDASGSGNTDANLLRHGPGLFYQGPQLAPVGGPPVVMTALRNRARGTSRVQGNRLSYDLTLGDSSQHLTLAWEVLPDRLVLRAVRTVERDIRAWRSSLWTIALHSVVAPCHVVGKIERLGETGMLSLPVWLHAPAFGSLYVDADTDAVQVRSDANRPRAMTSLELTLGEEPQPDGDVLLPAGRYEARVEFHVGHPDVPLAADTPPEVVRAVEACALTALTYRADTATLSNNGVSIHCPICMDAWAAMTRRIGRVLPNLEALDLLRDSLERWLDGAPGYTSGPLLQDGTVHDAEDEYVMTGAACLLGLAEFLEVAGTPEWLSARRDAIRHQIDAMRARDLDGDGLVESAYRTGTSGSGQWSTNWFDVVSYGWKDAFSNAVLYPALTRLAAVLPGLGGADLADGLDAWAEALRAAYVPTFYNEATGWLAGWRCAEDRLHDYAFLAPNGAAVTAGLLDDDLAQDVMERLWAEALRVRMPDAYLGLPGNLHSVADEDLADILQGYPLGFYQNGGRTHSQARHFVGALYRVGMTREADTLLARLCEGLADAAVFGGSGSGLDWRYWDGRPCGYEGLLTDQFGILAVALERYGAEAG